MNFAWAAALLLALLLPYIPFVSWSSPPYSHTVPRNERIDSWELQARLGTTPSEYEPSKRDFGMVSTLTSHSTFVSYSHLEMVGLLLPR
jgi:hypothetical protein